MSSNPSSCSHSKVKKNRSGYRGDPNAYRPFKCDQCDKAFRRRFTLQEHKKIHTGEKPFACNFPGCSSRFSTSGNLSRHKKVHLANRYRCPVERCGLAFSSHSGLSKHVKTHTESPPYACPVLSCPKVFSTAANLVRHTRSHRASELSSLDDQYSKISSQVSLDSSSSIRLQCHHAHHCHGSPVVRFPQIPRLSALPNIELPSPETQGHAYPFCDHASAHHGSHLGAASFSPSSSELNPFGMAHTFSQYTEEHRTYPSTHSPASSGYSGECTSPLSSSSRHILCHNSGFTPVFQVHPHQQQPNAEEWTASRNGKPSEMKAVLDNLLYGTEMGDSTPVHHHAHSPSSRPHSPFDIMHSMFNFEEQDAKVHHASSQHQVLPTRPTGTSGSTYSARVA